MQRGNFIGVFLARHVSGYIRPSSGVLDVALQHMFSAPNFWMDGGLQSRCVGRVYGADGAVLGTIRTAHTTYAAALKSTTHPQTRCGKHMLQRNI